MTGGRESGEVALHDHVDYGDALMGGGAQGVISGLLLVTEERGGRRLCAVKVGRLHGHWSSVRMVARGSRREDGVGSHRGSLRVCPGLLVVVAAEGRRSWCERSPERLGVDSVKRSRRFVRTNEEEGNWSL